MDNSVEDEIEGDGVVIVCAVGGGGGLEVLLMAEIARWT